VQGDPCGECLKEAETYSVHLTGINHRIISEPVIATDAMRALMLRNMLV